MTRLVPLLAACVALGLCATAVLPKVFIDPMVIFRLCKGSCDDYQSKNEVSFLSNWKPFLCRGFMC